VHLQSLSLRNFRNYRSLEVNFDPSGNLFLGGNAQGKTNLIEAIHYLATSRSQRNAGDGEILLQGEDFFLLRGTGQGEGQRSVTVEIRSFRNGPRQLKINGAVHRKVSDLLGLLSVIELSPEDVNISAGSPNHRRRFVDFCLCQMSTSYWTSLIDYGRVLQQRNTALKSRSGRRWHVADDGEMEAWDRQLIQLGADIIRRREQFLEQLNPEVDALHRQITGGVERNVLIYEPAIDRSQRGEITERFQKRLEQVKEKEVRLGVTLAGPHRDDFEITINGLRLRAFGSQGQQRTAAIALKLAAARRLEKAKGERPILLLDDVFAELDVDRTRSLFDQFDRFGQVFIATAKESDLAGCGGHLRVMSIADGTVITTSSHG
jgi:DNA replication and repair protein RecF